ncbi:hypothetical protein ADUPG1_007347, partial [Aduncisulcus paluster]
VIPGFMDLLSETEKKELNDRLQSTHHQHQHHHHHHQHQHQPILGEGEEPEEEEGMFPDVVQSRPILDEDEEEGGDDDNLDKGQNEISPDNADDTEEDPEIHIPENTFSRYIHAGKLLGNKRVTIHSKVSCVSTNVIPIPASKISRIRHETTEELFADSDFVLGPNISNVIDVLVTGLASRIPVFLESAPGQGKSAVVEHFAKSIGLDFKRLNFSNSTTVDSLFGYVASVRGEDGYPKFETIPGTLKKYIDSTSRKDKSVSNPCPRMVLLLDEINLAPPEVFDILIPLFGDSLEKSITLPDGSPCDVSHVMVVATLNPQELSGARMRIPPMVRESVLYTTIPSYSMDELIQIAKGKPHADTRYLEEKYLESTTMIHKACLDYCAKNGLTNSLSLREIIKVSEMLKTAGGAIEFSSILDIVYLSRFSPSEAKHIRDRIKLFPANDHVPLSLEKSSNGGTVCIGSAKIPLWTSSKKVVKHVNKAIDTHSFSSLQLQLLEKIATVVGTRRSIILSGPTAT